MKIFTGPDSGSDNALKPYDVVISVNDAMPKHNFSPSYWFPVDEMNNFWGYEPFFGVLRVVEKYYDKNLYLHCAAGVSRSPSIAYAVLYSLYGDSWGQYIVTQSDPERFFKKNLRRIPINLIDFLRIAHLNPSYSLLGVKQRIERSK